MPDIAYITQLLHLASLSKIVILVIFGIFIIFLSLVCIQVRSLNRIVTQSPYSTIVVAFSFLLVLTALALFGVSLVIL